MSFQNSRKVKSCKKAKRCDWCDEWIKVGESKIFLAHVFDGDFYTSHFHPECYESAQKWWDENRDEDCAPDRGTMKRGSTKGQDDE